MEICRQIDKLGRLVIPSDLRKAYGFKPGENVYFSMEENGILLHSKAFFYGSEKDKKD